MLTAIAECREPVSAALAEDGKPGDLYLAEDGHLDFCPESPGQEGPAITQRSGWVIKKLDSNVLKVETPAESRKLLVVVSPFGREGKLIESVKVTLVLLENTRTRHGRNDKQRYFINTDFGQPAH